MTTDEQTAAKIVEDHMNSVCETSMESAIVAALEAARDTAFVAGYAAGLDHLREASELRGIIDCTGEVPCVRRVLGTLPVTADGCVVGVGIHSQYHVSPISGAVFLRLEGSTMTHSHWYSTPEAAMEGGKA